MNKWQKCREYRDFLRNPNHTFRQTAFSFFFFSKTKSMEISCVQFKHWKFWENLNYCVYFLSNYMLMRRVSRKRVSRFVLRLPFDFDLTMRFCKWCKWLEVMPQRLELRSIQWPCTVSLLIGWKMIFSPHHRHQGLRVTHEHINYGTFFIR